MSNQSVTSAYAQAVLQNPDLPHGAVRLGLWIAAVAEQQGKFPVVSSVHNLITKGIYEDKVKAPPLSSRFGTITSAIEYLTAAGILSAPKRDDSRYEFTLTLGEAAHG